MSDEAVVRKCERGVKVKLRWREEMRVSGGDDDDGDGSSIRRVDR